MALIDNILSYWKLDETSGNRSDSVGSNTLTDNNTVGNATGKISNAASFTSSSSEYLSIATGSQSPDLSIGGSGGDIFISAWVKLATKPANAMQMVTKYEFSDGKREYALYWDNADDRFKLIVFDATTNSNTVTASTFGAPSTGVWYHVMAWVDNVANTVNICVNNGTVDSTSLTVTTHNGTATFRLGAAGNATPIEYWNGDIDETGVWNRVLSSSERTFLYNSTSGITYPFSSTTLTSYDGSNDDTNNRGGSQRQAQGFKIASNQVITGVGIKGSKGNNATAGSFILSIYEGGTHADPVSGTLIKTETFNREILPTYTLSPTIQPVIFTTPTATLTGGSTQYFLVMAFTGGDTNDNVRWSFDNSSPTYADGYYVLATTGSNWVEYSGTDTGFAIYGYTGTATNSGFLAFM